MGATKPVRLLVEAQEELDQSTGWYKQRGQELGQRFLRVVDDALMRMAASPAIGSRVLDLTRELQVRRIHLRGFPYSVIFLELEHEVVVLAFAHDRRQPGYWLERTGRV